MCTGGIALKRKTALCIEPLPFPPKSLSQDIHPTHIHMSLFVSIVNREIIKKNSYKDPPEVRTQTKENKYVLCCVHFRINHPLGVEHLPSIYGSAFNQTEKG